MIKQVSSWELPRIVLVKALVWLFQAYKLVLSPLLGPACRYYPSCSSYAVAAVSTHGASRGLLLTLWRLLRCHPFSSGGYDPVMPLRGPSPLFPPSRSKAEAGPGGLLTGTRGLGAG